MENCYHYNRNAAGSSLIQSYNKQYQLKRFLPAYKQSNFNPASLYLIKHTGYSLKAYSFHRRLCCCRRNKHYIMIDDSNTDFKQAVIMDTN